MQVAARSKKNQNGRRHRADGERSRQAILRAASELATVEGLEGLSIARLADHVGMSKSGLFAHFKSKEELQLATIDTASAIFDREVFEPALASSPGIGRVIAFCEAFFSHLERGIFPGGCFFISVAAEFDAKNGTVRDHALSAYSRVLARANEFFREEQENGELDHREDIAQLSFEVYSFLLSVNFGYVFFRDPSAIARGRESIRRLLQRAMPSKQITPKCRIGAESRRN
jgi:AcrR family transcriptional regulator